MMSINDAGNPAALKRLVAGGAQLRRFPQALMKPPTRDQHTYAEVSAKNAEFKKVYDSMVAFRGDQYLWWQVAELSFDSFMVRMRSRG